MTYWSTFLHHPASFYGYGVKEANETLLKDLFNTDSFRDVVHRTQDFYFSLVLKPDHPVGFRFMALGDFPKGLMGFYMDTQKDWKKVSGLPEQWAYRSSKLWLTQPDNGTALASNQPFVDGKIQGPQSAFTEAQMARMLGADLFFYIPDPVSIMGEGALSRLIPVESIEVWLTAQKDGYWGKVVFQFREARIQKLAGPLIKIVMAGWAALLDQTRAEWYQNLRYEEKDMSIEVGQVLIPYDRMLKLVAPLFGDLIP